MNQGQTIVFSLPENLYTAVAPILIRRAELLMDDASKKMQVRVIFKSICDKVISSVKVKILSYDLLNRPIGESISYSYDALAIEKDGEFGENLLIPMEEECRSFGLIISAVEFADKCVYSFAGEQWVPISATAEETEVDLQLNEHFEKTNSSESSQPEQVYASLEDCNRLNDKIDKLQKEIEQSKKRIKRTFKIAAFSISSLSFLAILFCVVWFFTPLFNFSYETVEGGYAISCNKSFLKNVEIPEKHLGKPVVKINDYAFYSNTRLESVTLPSSVSAIGQDAFTGCDKFKYNVYDNAFYLGTSDNPYHLLVKGKNQFISACVIHQDTKFIAETAFSGCNSLSVITVSEGVTAISPGAFKGCLSLDTILLPTTLTAIGDRAFQGCVLLSGITLPQNLTDIGDSAFEGCKNLTEINIPGNVNSIGNYAFLDCKSLAEANIGGGVTSIGIGAFKSCSALRYIFFMDESKWYVTDNYSDWKNKSGGAALETSNGYNNKNFLCDTYVDYYWYKK